MAPGPTVLSGNKFAVLEKAPQSLPESNVRKRKKNNNPTYIELDKTVQINSTLPDPKFIVISSSDEKKPLSSISVFLLKKAIDGISTAYESITELRDGSLLLLAKSAKIANLFLSKKHLANLCPISVKLQSNLNSCKGTAYAKCLINVPEEEIISEMKCQGVTEVYKFKKTTPDNKQEATGLILFTFDRFRPPSTVDIGWHKAKIEEYFPNPMRCRKCQLLGHTTKRCSSSEICQNCNLAPHQPENCTRISCANCAEEHPSSSKLCKEYIKAKEILKIKTINKCSMADAKKIYKEKNPIQFFSTTYSSVLQNSSTSSKQNTTTGSTPPPQLLPSNSYSDQATISTSTNNTSKQNLYNQSTTIIDSPTQTNNCEKTIKQKNNEQLPHTSPPAPIIPARTIQKSTSTISPPNTITDSTPTPTFNKNNKYTHTNSLSHTHSVETTQSLTPSSFPSPLTNLTNTLLSQNLYYQPGNHMEQDDDST
ncbi:uncharacterized protein LOC129950395 [Eupeodes corollae]|uniref:uncharacterized protein LOC129950395 n=1 Tax=Eupeodes corollae TaxID=290404 RepID=UPI00248FCD01|nr:uncharacterized protein LOC129950395 [Eupeodes corollae]